MKTLNYLPTLLAITIQVMVIGQTQNNQDHKIRMDIMGQKEPVKMNYSNSNVTLNMSEYSRILEQANDLKISASKLRDEAGAIETQSLQKHIEASEFAAKISLQKFTQNRLIIIDLFTETSKTHKNYSRAQLSYEASERLMKIAKEMREEANAQFSLQAKFGNMTNAEANETLAIDKQAEVLSLLNYNYPQLVQNIKEKVTESTITRTQNQINVSQMSNKTVVAKQAYSTIDLLAAASEQAYEMKATAQQLRMSAITSSPNQKNVLLNEAISLEIDYVSKQVEISMLKSKLDYEKFNKNRKIITLLLESITDNNALADKAINLNNEAERLMKIGKEMREEANAQLTAAAKYGEMSNAEENETLALGKQNESIQLVQTNSSKMIVASR